MRNGLVSVLCLALLGICTDALVAQRGAGPAPAPPVQTPAGRGEASPASQRPPQTKTPQSFPRDQVEAGRTQFAIAVRLLPRPRCRWRRGRPRPDAVRSRSGGRAGRSTRSGHSIRPAGPGYARVSAVATAISPPSSRSSTIRSRRPTLANGGRRSVDATDLETGNAAAGKRYFDAACARCHSATGDLAGVATRHQGLTLLQRMLYPSAAGRGSSGAACRRRSRSRCRRDRRSPGGWPIATNSPSLSLTPPGGPDRGPRHK